MTKAEFNNKWAEWTPYFLGGIEALLDIRSKKDQIPATADQYLKVAKLAVWGLFYTGLIAESTRDSEYWETRTRLFILQIINAHIDVHNRTFNQSIQQ